MIDITVEEVVALGVPGIEPREVWGREGTVGRAVRPCTVEREGTRERIVLLTCHHAEICNITSPVLFSVILHIGELSRVKSSVLE